MNTVKKKILLFSLAYYPKHIGGAEVAIKEITDRLSTNEYEFHLVCNRYDATLPTKEQIGNVLIHRIGITTNNPSMADLRRLPLQINKVLYQWLAYYKARQLHKKYQYDGIWAMMAHATGVPAARFKRKFPEVRYVLTLQEGDPPEYIEQKMRWLKKDFAAAFTTADTIQVISSFLGKWAKQKQFPGEPVLIPNAVDTAHFTQKYSDQELREVRRVLAVNQNDTLLVTTSRLVHKNAVDDVITALSQLPTTVKFVIFGVGPDEKKLKKQVEQLGLQKRVIFGGELPHEKMPKYLQACDIFVRPSRSEGMGNSFIEAMATKLPVIATQEGGIADFLFDQNRNPGKPATGWAVDKNQPTQIAAAVQNILLRPEKVERITAQAKALVIEKYDWNVVAAAMDEQVFQQMFNNSSRH